MTERYTMEAIIAKIEKELAFQKKQAKEFEKGIYKNEVTFARYDQGAKMLEWVLKIIRDGQNDAFESEGYGH